MVFFSVGNSSGEQGSNSKLTGDAHLYRIFSVLRAEELPLTLWHRWGGVPGWAPKQLNGGGRVGEREKGKEEGRRREQGRTVSWEIPLRLRPHLKAIVMSCVEPPDSFLPLESMKPPAPAWRLGRCWTRAPDRPRIS